MNQKIKKIIIVLILGIALPFVTATTNATPQTLYRVYLKGESIGLIKSRTQLEEYIDKKQDQIKEKFDVDKVYLPEDLDIVKEVTFDNDISTVKEIYNKIKDISPFTIKGYAITIGAVDSQAADGTKIKGKKQTIYVLDKQVFEDAVDNIVHSFISEEDYENYANGTQEEIEDRNNLGKILYSGQEIEIPYHIPQSELAEYTTSDIYNQGQSLEDFATIHETTVDSIISLNEDTIIETDEGYAILSDTLQVPTFQPYNYESTRTK